MRIRSTKPEFWASKRIASVSWEDRLLLKGLESYVDDNGVGIDDVELIVTDVFPRDMFRNPRETVARVSEGIGRLHQAGLIHRYEGGGDQLLYVSFWEEIQRIDKPGKGRKPRPDGTSDYKDSIIRESVASPPETLAPGTGEQGNRGTGEQGTSAPPERAPQTPPPAEPPTTDEPNSATLVAEWIDHQNTRPPGRVIGQLSKEIKTLLTEGTPYDEVRAAVQEWQKRSLHPSTLASVLHELRNPPAPRRQSAADQKLAVGAERHQRLANYQRKADPFALIQGELES